MSHKEKPKVVIGLAVQDTVKTLLLLSLVNTLRMGKENYDFDINVSMGCDLIGSRTRLARMAQGKGTHLLYIDHDMVLNPTKCPDSDETEDPISRALRADKDVVGAPYNFRSIRTRSTAIPEDRQPVDGKFEIDPKTLPKGLFKAQALGTGFLLIKMSVFDKIEKPWFQFGRDANQELVYGEDTFFVQQCRKAGVEVWCDGGLKIGHLGDLQY